MAILSLRNISIAFGGEKILDDLNLEIEKNQRVCLLGRNGAGKSTLMKIISAEIAPDEGKLHKEQNTRISYFAQQIPQELPGTVFEIIAAGLGKRGELFLNYNSEEKKLARNADHDHSRLNRLIEEMDKLNAWAVMEEIDKIISRMSLDKSWEYRSLSGGQKRRVLLAKALVSEPDLLLLDEPTNHLDIEAISWMEEFLLRSAVTCLFVTHDRMLLKKLATRIIELDRGALVDWSCDYDTFLSRKQAVLDAEEKEWENFDKKLAQEEIWIRRGIRARRTRNEGRVRALLKMREERKKRRYRDGNATINISDAEKSGKLVLEAKKLTYGYDDKMLIDGFSSLIVRGDKIGIIGPNGCGKTTLINLLLAKMAPLSGTVTQGSNLSVVYYDQMREQLDEEKSVWENVLPNGNMVTIDGKSRHVITYLQDFLFTPDRAKSPVSQLSGGERNRLLLARLFTQSANLLVFDEPTNDLDAETLELFEELLVGFKGTILLISHDRAFLNNVVTSTIVFSEDGKIKEYVGGYDDWLAQKQVPAVEAKNENKVDKKQQYRKQQKEQRKKKRTFKENEELKTLPAIIENLENELTAIHEQMADPSVYRDKDKVLLLKEKLAATEQDLAVTYERWELLESIEE